MTGYQILFLCGLPFYAASVGVSIQAFVGPELPPALRRHGPIAAGSLVTLAAYAAYWTSTGIFPGARPFGFFSLYVLFTFLAADWLAHKYRIEQVAFAFQVIPLLSALPLPFIPADAPLVLRLPPVVLASHLITTLLSLALFSIAVSGGILLYLQDRLLKEKNIGFLGQRLPPVGLLDTLTYRCMLMGFSLLTLGVVLGFLGALWARGGPVPLGLKGVLGTALWGIYGTYLFTRRRRGWRGRTQAFFALVGFVVAAALALMSTLIAPSPET